MALLWRVLDVHSAVFQRNYEELTATLTAPVTPTTQFIHMGLGGEKARIEKERHFFNFLASGKMVGDVLRAAVEDTADTALQAAFRREVANRVTDDQAVRFMNRLRDYATHYRLPLVGSTGTLVIDPDTQEHRGEWRYYLDRDELLKWPEPDPSRPRWQGGWRGIRPYLLRQPKEIDMLRLVNHYANRLQLICAWIHEQTMEDRKKVLGE